MSTTNSQVAHVWAHRQAGKAGNLTTDGTALKSYWATIAEFVKDPAGQEVIFISYRKYSVTTSAHESLARQAIRHLSGDVYYTSDFIDHPINNIKTDATNHIEEFKILLRKRKPQVDWYETRRQDIIDMAARFNVTIPEIPEATGDLKEKARAYKEAEKVREAARVEKAARDLATRQELDKVQFDTWITTGEGSCPVSFIAGYQYGYYSSTRPAGTTDFLTIRDSKVITSQGAEAPLEHVIKALRFYDSRDATKGLKPVFNMSGYKVEIFEPYQTNGHKIPLGQFTLDSIDEQGNVKAGCHYFTAAEIARFRKQRGL